MSDPVQPLIPRGHTLSSRNDSGRTIRGRLVVGDVSPPLPGATWSYAMSRLDSSGRVTEQSMVARLQWSAADRLTATAHGSDAVIIRRDTSGAFELSGRRRIRIPASLRARCALNAGDQVLLAASTRHDLLLVHTMAALDQLLRNHHHNLVPEATP